MALDPEVINSLLDQIEEFDHHTFRSSIAHLFNYLETEVKDNPVFEKYEDDVNNWKNWPSGQEGLRIPGQWSVPEDLENMKSLSYTLYKKIGVNDDSWANSFSVMLFRKTKIRENFEDFNSTFLRYFKQVLQEIINANPEVGSFSPKKIKSQTIFIIHGHDDELKSEVQILLFNAKTNCIILHERPDMGRTIIDKLIGETEDSAYAIALLSPDDLTNEGKNRARQNVILEIGYFLGKLGKERVRMLVKGDLEIPSDLHGVLYTKYEKGGEWKSKLIKELIAVGINVDLEGLMKKM